MSRWKFFVRVGKGVCSLQLETMVGIAFLWPQTSPFQLASSPRWSTISRRQPRLLRADHADGELGDTTCFLMKHACPVHFSVNAILLFVQTRTWLPEGFDSHDAGVDGF
jgi:hypothetical protein